MTTVGLDLGHTSVVDAEHWLREHVAGLGGPWTIACTHQVHGEHPRVALSVSGVVDPGALVAERSLDEAVAATAATQHATRRAGRAVLYPGVAGLTGTVPVGDLFRLSAIERVVVIGGPPAALDTLLDTRDFVRPEWRDGLLTLVTTPAPRGRIAPFEVPNPTPCCADHR